jgi:hypothetical protein
MGTRSGGTAAAVHDAHVSRARALARQAQLQGLLAHQDRHHQFEPPHELHAGDARRAAPQPDNITMDRGLQLLLQAGPSSPTDPSVINDSFSLTVQFISVRDFSITDYKHEMNQFASNRLMLPKCMGGTGFWDMRLFNQALLARQAWWLIQYPDS